MLPPWSQNRQNSPRFSCRLLRKSWRHLLPNVSPFSLMDFFGWWWSVSPKVLQNIEKQQKRMNKTKPLRAHPPNHSEKGNDRICQTAFVGVLRGNKGEQNNKTSQFLMLVLFWNAVSWMKKFFSTTTWFGTSDLEIWCIHKDSNVEHLNPWTVRHNTC